MRNKFNVEIYIHVFKRGWVQKHGIFDNITK